MTLDEGPWADHHIQLDALLRELEASIEDDTPGDTGALAERARMFAALPWRRRAQPGEPPEELRSRVRQAVQQLLVANGRILGRMQDRMQDRVGAPDRQSAAAGHVSIASMLFTGCIDLAPADCARGVQLLLGSGTLVLMSTATLEREAGDALADDLLALVEAQVTAMLHVLECSRMEPDNGASLESLATQHAPPGQLMDWVEAVVQAMQALLASGPAGPVHMRILGPMAHVLRHMVKCPRFFSPHRDEWLRRLDLSHSLLMLLLPALSATAAAVQLPEERRPQRACWELAASLAIVVSCGAIRHALLELLAASAQDSSSPAATSIARLTRAATALMQHVPLGDPTQAAVAGGPQAVPDHRFWIAFSMSKLLGLSAYLQWQLLDRQPATARPSDAAQRHAHFLPLFPRLGRVLGMAIGAAKHSPGNASWSLVSDMFAFVDYLAQLLCILAEPRSNPHGALKVECPLIRAPLSRSTLDALAAWCSCAADALQLLPLVAKAEAEAEASRLRLGPVAAEVDAQLLDVPDQLAARLAGLPCLVVLACKVFSHLGEPDHPTAVAAVLAEDGQRGEVLLSSLRRLHASGCRYVHWRAADGDAPLPCYMAMLEVVAQPASVCCQLHDIVERCSGTSTGDISGDSSGGTAAALAMAPSRWLQGLCAAHAQAVQVLLPRMHGTGLSQVQHLHVACCLLDVVAWAPAALATSRELQLGLTYALEALAPQGAEQTQRHIHGLCTQLSTATKRSLQTGSAPIQANSFGNA